MFFTVFPLGDFFMHCQMLITKVTNVKTNKNFTSFIIFRFFYETISFGLFFSDIIDLSTKLNNLQINQILIFCLFCS